MFHSIQRKQTTLAYRAFSAFIATTFIFSSIVPPQRAYAQTVLNLPAPGTMVTLSPVFNPPIIKGITIHPENPLMFDFIVHPGDNNLQGQDLEDESTKLIKYFMASLTVPEDQMWVNLSPYEQDRIVPESFGQTEMGRDLLAQDYLLKQLTASLMYPEDELGEKFWKRIRKKAYEQFGTTEIPLNTFNKIWIVPEKASIYENGTSVFVVDSHLKVMLEEDYLALEANQSSTNHGLGDLTKDDLNVISGVSSSIIREILIPEIEREVNEGETFANLRQIYHSVILATWYKQNLKESLLGQVYVNQNKTEGIDIEDKQINEKIYSQYLEAFKVGVYDYIKEDYDPRTNEIIPRKYFSGGANLRTRVTKAFNPLVEPFEGTQIVRAGFDPIGDMPMGASSPVRKSEEITPKKQSKIEIFQDMVMKADGLEYDMQFYQALTQYREADQYYKNNDTELILLKKTDIVKTRILIDRLERMLAHIERIDDVGSYETFLNERELDFYRKFLKRNLKKRHLISNDIEIIKHKIILSNSIDDLKKVISSYKLETENFREVIVKNREIIASIVRHSIDPDIHVIIVRSLNQDVEDGSVSIEYRMMVLENIIKGKYRIVADADISMENNIMEPIKLGTATFERGKYYMQRTVELLLLTGKINEWRSASHVNPSAGNMYKRLKKDPRLTVVSKPGYFSEGGYVVLSEKYKNSSEYNNLIEGEEGTEGTNASSPVEAMVLKEVAQILEDSHSLKLHKGSQLALNIEKQRTYSKKENGYTNIYSSSGRKLVEISELGTKRFFDEHQRWIITIDPFGTMTEELQWDKTGDFVKLRALHSNGRILVLDRDVEARYKRELFVFNKDEVIRGILVFNEDEVTPLPLHLIEDYGAFLKNADMVPNAFPNRKKGQGVGVIILGILSQLAEDKGNQLYYMGSYPYIGLYQSLLEVATTDSSNTFNNFKEQSKVVYWTPNPPERIFNPDSKMVLSIRDGQVIRVYFDGRLYLRTLEDIIPGSKSNVSRIFVQQDNFKGYVEFNNKGKITIIDGVGELAIKDSAMLNDEVSTDEATGTNPERDDASSPMPGNRFATEEIGANKWNEGEYLAQAELIPPDEMNLELAYNPALQKISDNFYLIVYRGVKNGATNKDGLRSDNTTSFYAAFSSDGITVDEWIPDPIMATGTNENELNSIEDPRLMLGFMREGKFFPDLKGDIVAMFYVGYNIRKDSIQIGTKGTPFVIKGRAIPLWATISVKSVQEKTFSQLKRRGRIHIPVMVNGTDLQEITWNKDMTLFPEPVFIEVEENRKMVRKRVIVVIDRPMNDRRNMGIRISWRDAEKGFDGSWIPDGEKILLEPELGTWKETLGVGGTPVKTADGWVFPYHGTEYIDNGFDYVIQTLEQELSHLKGKSELSELYQLTEAKLNEIKERKPNWEEEVEGVEKEIKRLKSKEKLFKKEERDLKKNEDGLEKLRIEAKLRIYRTGELLLNPTNISDIIEDNGPSMTPHTVYELFMVYGFLFHTFNDGVVLLDSDSGELASWVGSGDQRMNVFTAFLKDLFSEGALKEGRKLSEEASKISSSPIGLRSIGDLPDTVKSIFMIGNWDLPWPSLKPLKIEESLDTIRAAFDKTDEVFFTSHFRRPTQAQWENDATRDEFSLHAQVVPVAREVFEQEGLDTVIIELPHDFIEIPVAIGRAREAHPDRKRLYIFENNRSYPYQSRYFLERQPDQIEQTQFISELYDLLPSGTAIIDEAPSSHDTDATKQMTAFFPEHLRAAGLGYQESIGKALSYESRSAGGLRLNLVGGAKYDKISLHLKQFLSDLGTAKEGDTFYIVGALAYAVLRAEGETELGDSYDALVKNEQQAINEAWLVIKAAAIRKGINLFVTKDHRIRGLDGSHENIGVGQAAIGPGDATVDDILRIIQEIKDSGKGGIFFNGGGTDIKELAAVLETDGRIIEAISRVADKDIAVLASGGDTADLFHVLKENGIYVSDKIDVTSAGGTIQAGLAIGVTNTKSVQALLTTSSPIGDNSGSIDLNPQRVDLSQWRAIKGNAYIQTVLNELGVIQQKKLTPFAMEKLPEDLLAEKHQIDLLPYKLSRKGKTFFKSLFKLDSTDLNVYLANIVIESKKVSIPYAFILKDAKNKRVYHLQLLGLAYLQSNRVDNKVLRKIKFPNIRLTDGFKIPRYDKIFRFLNNSLKTSWDEYQVEGAVFEAPFKKMSSFDPSADYDERWTERYEAFIMHILQPPLEEPTFDQIRGVGGRIFLQPTNNQDNIEILMDPYDPFHQDFIAALEEKNSTSQRNDTTGEWEVPFQNKRIGVIGTGQGGDILEILSHNPASIKANDISSLAAIVSEWNVRLARGNGMVNSAVPVKVSHNSGVNGLGEVDIIVGNIPAVIGNKYMDKKSTEDQSAANQNHLTVNGIRKTEFRKLLKDIVLKLDSSEKYAILRLSLEPSLINKGETEDDARNRYLKEAGLEGNSIYSQNDDIWEIKAIAPRLSARKTAKGSSPIINDESQGKNPGGIDLNPNHIDLISEGQSVNLNMPSITLEEIQNMNIQGFLPIIINITPVINIPLLLGIADQEEKPTDLGYNSLDPMEKRDRFKVDEPEQLSLLN